MSHDGPTPKIRPAVVGDAGELLTVLRAAYVTEAQLNRDVNIPPLHETLEELRAVIEFAGGISSAVLVAREGHRLVGTGRAALAGTSWRIGRLAVVPDRQGSGLGRALVAELERRAPLPATMATLFTGVESRSNVRWYERLGYRRAAERDGLVHLVKELGADGPAAPSETAPPSLLRRVDHVGVAVADLDAAIAFHRDVFGMPCVHREINPDQGVEEAMIDVGDGVTQLQLLAPLDPNSTIARFLDRHGPGVQQVAYTVDDVAAVAATLRARGLRLLYDSARPGTSGSRVNFVHPKDAGGVLIELVEPRTDPPPRG